MPPSVLSRKMGLITLPHGVCEDDCEAVRMSALRIQYKVFDHKMLLLLLEGAIGLKGVQGRLSGYVTLVKCLNASSVKWE